MQKEKSAPRSQLGDAATGGEVEDTRRLPKRDQTHQAGYRRCLSEVGLPFLSQGLGGAACKFKLVNRRLAGVPFRSYIRSSETR